MAQENEIPAEEQLKAFQADYREVLSSRYGLDPAVAKAIPSGTASEMEAQARLMHEAAQSGVKSDTYTPASAAPFPRTIRATVASLMAQKYKGPEGKG